MKTRMTAQHRAEKRVLAWLAQNTDEREAFSPFAPICEDLKLTRAAVRRACRSLARKGLAVYARGLWRDDGPGGAGYAVKSGAPEAVK